MATALSSRPPLPPNGLAGLVRPGRRSPETVEFEVDTVNFFVSAAVLLGVPKSVAAIYGIIFASPDALSFSEIATRLNISKGSVSQGVRFLREVGALKVIRVDDARREYFAPDMELRLLIHRFVDHRLRSQLDMGEKHLALIMNRVPLADAKSAELLRRRLKNLVGWHERARAVLPIVRTFLRLGK